MNTNPMPVKPQKPSRTKPAPTWRAATQDEMERLIAREYLKIKEVLR